MGSLHVSQVGIVSTKTIEHMCRLLELINMLKRAEFCSVTELLQKSYRFTVGSITERILIAECQKLDSSWRKSCELYFQLEGFEGSHRINIPLVFRISLYVRFPAQTIAL